MLLAFGLVREPVCHRASKTACFLSARPPAVLLTLAAVSVRLRVFPPPCLYTRAPIAAAAITLCGNVVVLGEDTWMDIVKMACLMLENIAA